MKTQMGRLLILVAVLVLGAAPSAVQAQKKSRDVITREEILKSPQRDRDLYAAIKALRPNFLQAPRGVRSSGGSFTAGLAVYVDKIRQSGADALFQMMASDVAEVRYLDPSRSENEFGITANGGALVITRYRQQSVADSLNKKPPH